MDIEIQTDNGPKTIATTDDSADPVTVLQAHGYDPSTTEYTVSESADSRLSKIENATGVGGRGETGIANRIDDLESRVSNLEDKH